VSYVTGLISHGHSRAQCLKRLYCTRCSRPGRKRGRGLEALKYRRLAIRMIYVSRNQSRDIVQIRMKHGLIRRMTLFRRHKFNERLFEVLKQELENGRVEGFGRELLYTHFRTNGHLDPR
jgi:hypothetical protein